jgi:aspartyl protease family protein
MPERLVPEYAERPAYIVPFSIALAFLIAGGAAAFFYFQLQMAESKLQPARDLAASKQPAALPKPEPFGRFKKVYEDLDITSLPASFERNTEASKLLDQLQREPCDREAVEPLANVMVQSGYPREAAKSALKFGQRCGHSADLLEVAYAAFTRLSDYNGALGASEEMIKLDQASGRYRFLRGTAQERLKNYKAALSDSISTLQLFVDLSNVAPSEFYWISRMYDAVGRPCDAITPLEMYLSYDVANRQTPQISQMIREYANKGNCRATYATGSDRLLIGSTNVVDVTINGAKGRMIVDTGASMVSMTAAFAARARILPDESNPITFHVVGGTVQSAPGYAQLIEVGRAQAANVPVAIGMGSSGTYGPQVDGLLGMTFLARFNVVLAGGALELKPRILN